MFMHTTQGANHGAEPCDAAATAPPATTAATSYARPVASAT